MAKKQNNYRLPIRGRSSFRGYIDRLFFDQRTSPNGFLIRPPMQKNVKAAKAASNKISPRLVSANIGVLGFALLIIGVISVIAGEKDGFFLVILGGAICIATFGVMAMQIFNYNRIGRR